MVQVIVELEGEELGGAKGRGGGGDERQTRQDTKGKTREGGEQ